MKSKTAHGPQSSAAEGADRQFGLTPPATRRRPATRPMSGNSPAPGNAPAPAYESASGVSLMRRMRRNRDVAITGLNAKIYNRQGRRYRQAEFRALAAQVAARIPAEARVLEIASGSGYLAIELSRLGRTRIHGTDISADQVAIAGKNAGEAGTSVEFSVADVRAIPFPDASFDYGLCFAAFKNFQDPAGALVEIHRVLVPGGTLIIGDMSSDIPNEAIEQYLDDQHIRGINRFLLRRTFRFLRRGAYSHAELSALIDEAPFRSHEIVDDGIGFTLSLTK